MYLALFGAVWLYPSLVRAPVTQVKPTTIGQVKISVWCLIFVWWVVGWGFLRGQRTHPHV